jgi:hypothetical protein
MAMIEVSALAFAIGLYNVAPCIMAEAHREP